MVLVHCRFNVIFVRLRFNRNQKFAFKFYMEMLKTKYSWKHCERRPKIYSYFKTCYKFLTMEICSAGKETDK